jgi:hypothetical protein
MLPRSIFIEARQWVDKTYGNSYFSARISVDGETVGYLPFQYGYETAYKDAAFRWLQDNEYAPRDARTLYGIELSGDVVYTVIYDAKRADVKRFGVNPNE